MNQIKLFPELSFVEQIYWKRFSSILITEAKTSYLSLLAEFLCTFKFQTKINYYSCQAVMHLNIFKLLKRVKLSVMLSIYLPAAILFTNTIMICILLIYFSVLAFYFSAVCLPIQLYNSF